VESILCGWLNEADDVDKQAVKDILDEVNISCTYPTLQTTVQKWWY